MFRIDVRLVTPLIQIDGSKKEGERDIIQKQSRKSNFVF